MSATTSTSGVSSVTLPTSATARRVIVAIASATSRDQVGGALVSLGYVVTLAESPIDVLAQARSHMPQLLVTDPEFVSGGGEDVWSLWRSQLGGASIVVLPELSLVGVEAAADSLAETPGGLAHSELMIAVERVVGASRSRATVAARSERRRPILDPFVGQSPAMRRLAEDALKALASESPILIEGETGSGKGVLAAWLHRHGPRAQEAFVDLNCAGFSRELMDSELFGHEKGAFTGAVTSKAGLLEVADRGTLFLDEVGDMDGPIQAKLLKVIEDRRFRRVGETRERHADARVIAATHHHLLQRVRDGLFREDLFYRIGVLPLRIPALRFRSGDIPTLARRILTQLAIELGRPEPELTPAAEDVLIKHPWPGNLRELRNELERAILACGEGLIESRHLELEPSGSLPACIGPDGGTLADVERAYIQRVLEEEQDTKRAMQRLGMARSTFYTKLRVLGIPAPLKSMGAGTARRA